MVESGYEKSQTAVEVENDAQNSPAPIEAPRGTLSARVDEKGRLKLPAALTHYLEAVGDRKVFITSLNLSNALIYPISIWKETEKMLGEGGEDAAERAEVAFVANHYGEDCEIDGQGRVLIPTILRRELELEKDDVHLLCFKGRIEVYGSKVYEQRLNRAKVDIADKLAALEKKGLR